LSCLYGTELYIDEADGIKPFEFFLPLLLFLSLSIISSIIEERYFICSGVVPQHQPIN